jgi:hypothetical protein
LATLETHWLGLTPLLISPTLRRLRWCPLS